MVTITKPIFFSPDFGFFKILPRLNIFMFRIVTSEYTYLRDEKKVLLQKCIYTNITRNNLREIKMCVARYSNKIWAKIWVKLISD